MADNVQARDANGVIVTIRTKDTAGVQTEQVGNEAGSQVDGHSVTLGAIADAAWSGSGSASAIALLKDIAAHLRGSLTTTIGGSIASTNAAASQADGHSATLGATTDAAVTTSATGTVSAKLRGLVAILADVWDSTNHQLRTSAVTPVAEGDIVVGAKGAQQAWLASDGQTQHLDGILHPHPITRYTSGGTETGTVGNPDQVTQAALNRTVDNVSSGALIPFAATKAGTGAAQTLITAPSAGNHICIYKLAIINAAAVAVTPGIRNGSGGTDNLLTPLSANIGDGKNIGPTQGYIPLTGGGTPAALTTSAYALGAGTSVSYIGLYAIEADNAKDTATAALW